MLFCFFLQPNYGTAQAPTPAIDFSHAGYGGGGVAIPAVPAVLTVSPTGGDDTRLLQAAINQLATMPVQANGFRGALQLTAGRFLVEGQLQVKASGIVVRGSGSNATTLIATGTDRRALLTIGTAEAARGDVAIAVTDNVVAAGGKILTLEKVQGLQVDDLVIVSRPSTKEWITAIGSDTIKGAFADLRLRWPAGSRDLVWHRRITAIDITKNQITLDAPITTALEKRFGSGTVAKVAAQEPVQRVGLDNLLLESTFNKSNPKDESHAWFGIFLNHVEDAWVRNVTARHFASSAVHAGPGARRVTVVNCRSEQPVAEIGGYRRYSFLVEGQQVLVQNCTADAGFNDFATALTAAGPNVFLRCTATNAHGYSGTFESWASGVLYEEVQINGAGIHLTYDLNSTQGGGWTAANSFIWNCKAPDIQAKGPAEAPVHVVNAPQPLYERQLAARLGKQALAALKAASQTDSVAPANLPAFTAAQIPAAPAAAAPPTQALEIVNGRFVVAGKALWGGAINDAWWLGHPAPGNALDGGVSITRFMPGREGPGHTENLPKLAARVVRQGTPFYQSGPPGLWYDRRRDDHTLAERPDAYVWAPFLEMPWERSGRGRAWDGLSQYDLTQYNPWYFKRLREFAKLSDQHGILLYHHLYNTHNLLEVGAHWVDFPWRPANNINTTGLPEPPPLDEDKRIHVANEFYDPANPHLRELHRSYILHVLDQIGTTENTIFGTGFQFFGPLVFQQFFQQTVAEWEKQHNQKVRLVIGTSKEITDAVLADPELRDQIAVIDMRYWQYLPDGTLWAPEGGKNLAFREMVREKFNKGLDFPDPTTPEQAYRQVREYRDKFPEKAIVAWHNDVGPIPALMAGAAQVLTVNPAAGHRQGRIVDATPLDAFVKTYLANKLMRLNPQDDVLTNPSQNWTLADTGQQSVLFYSLSGSALQLQQKLPKKAYTGIWYDPRTGETQAAVLPKRLKKGTAIAKPSEENWLLLLQ
ncbi:right-handed parallel beta-helix repeat-containing protein [Pontibacter qinzhouensis]|uniref:Right-handed parallel beta-helix repeat-containing protein n=1 Tax=Pontibacter qinzhouensis TaxID=2603253 RepID=A0A5C8JHP7_9BACT|nr:DUF6298 domain-containing protein [Pontibacter qinzhouensis]TXK36523.1 right-handed parallel beta-helix repeat-containing protein [Pontibacter qinzhouensis]